MIKDRAVARRYAEGFLLFAKESISEKKGVEELSFVGRVVNSDPYLKKFLENVKIGLPEKSRVIDAVFKDTVSDQTRHALNLIIQKGRIEVLSDIAAYADTLYCHEEKIEKVLIKTAKPLSKEAVDIIKDRVEKKLNKRLEAEAIVQEDLIGGVEIQIGNVVIDGSVRKKLAQLKEALMEIKVN